MGTALAQILAKQGRRVWLWDYNPKTVAIIKRTGKNQQFLPGVKLSTRILACASMMDAVEKAELVVIACASPYVRSTTKHAVHCLQGRKVVISQIAKGLEEKTFLTMHEVVQSELPTSLKRLVVTLSGPSIAKEFVAGMPTAVVAASQNKAASKLVQQVFESATFKAEISADWKGVALCGALKNVYAIALGMCDGLRLTMNAKAFLLTVALAETKRITVSLGGKRETVYGLAGLGDAIAR